MLAKTDMYDWELQFFNSSVGMFFKNFTHKHKIFVKHFFFVLIDIFKYQLLQQFGFLQYLLVISFVAQVETSL